MANRRTVVSGLSLLLVSGSFPGRLRAQVGPSAEALIAVFEQDPNLAGDNKGTGEAQQIDLALRADRGFARAFAPRNEPSERRISPLAQRLIIASEVTSAAVYAQRYCMPVWPQGESGPTIGVGYDLRFIKPEWLQEDWGAFLDEATLVALRHGCLLHGAPARQFCSANRTLFVGWVKAQAQFLNVLLPRYITETLVALPGAKDLSDDCLGALVSLVYNRGASFRKSGPKYTEMRAIYIAMRQKNFAAIPDHILTMKRLWPDVKGLLARRDAEAALFRKGLA